MFTRMPIGASSIAATLPSWWPAAFEAL